LSLAIMLNGPISVVPHRDKAFLFTRSSILFRPLTPSNEREFGGAAGYRPRVRSAYYRRVYVHSSEEHSQYREGSGAAQGAICSAVGANAQVMHNPCTSYAYRTRRKIKEGLRNGRNGCGYCGREVSTGRPLHKPCIGGPRCGEWAFKRQRFMFPHPKKIGSWRLWQTNRRAEGRPGDARWPSALIPRVRPKESRVIDML
jgi:hypothetical protein